MQTNTARTSNRFKRGSGVFECNDCTRKTRDTGGDNTDLKLCEECYEIAGIENAINDGTCVSELIHKRAELKARCIAKGGKL